MSLDTEERPAKWVRGRSKGSKNRPKGAATGQGTGEVVAGDQGTGQVVAGDEGTSEVVAGDWEATGATQEAATQMVSISEFGGLLRNRY